MKFESSATGGETVFPWYINRRYGTLLVGSTLSNFGDSIFEWTLVLWAANVFGTSGSWLVSGVIIASAVPTILFGPVAGTLVDQWRDKLRVAVVASILSGVLILALVPFVMGEHTTFGLSVPVGIQIWLVLAVVVAASLVAQLLGPAQGVIRRDLLPPELRERAVALGQFSRSTVLLIAPALAAPIYAAFGIGWALVINGLSFFVAVVFLRLATHGMATPAGATDGATDVEAEIVGEARVVGQRLREIGRDLRAGIRFARTSPTMSTVLVAMGLVMLGSGVWNAVDVFFFRDRLGGSNAAFGLLGSGQAVGELVGAVILLRLVDRIGSRRLLWGGMALLGGLSFVYALMTTVPAAIVVVALMGLATPAFNIALGPMMMRVTPRSYLGRMTGTIGPVLSGSLMIGTALGGAVVALAGTSFSLGAIEGINTLVLLVMLPGVFILVAAVIAFVRLRSTAALAEYEAAPGNVDG